MRRLATLAIALALLFPSGASGEPDPIRTNLLDNGFEYTIPFDVSDTDDSKAMRVRGMCSVVWERGGSDVVELYAIPTRSTAATSGTLLGTFTTSTTAATTFQAGTRWVKAVATTAATGGSVMRIHCSNSQVASTGEACTTAGLAPYVGDLGGYKCEADYSYNETTNQLNVGEVAVDAAAGKNAIRMEANSAFTGTTATSSEVLLYALTDAVEPGLYIETLDSLDDPSRVIQGHPDYYDAVLSWGVEFTDVNAEYEDLSPGPGTPVVRKFCMVKSAGAFKEEIYTTADVSTTITIPLAGSNGCSATAGAAKQVQAYWMPGDPWIADAWCFTRTNIASGGDAWNSGDEVLVRFGVSNNVDLASAEYMTAAHDMIFGHDELTTVDRYQELREVVDAYPSSFFAGSLSPGAVNTVLFTASIEGMTRAAISTWNTMQLTCSLGIMFKDTR